MKLRMYREYGMMLLLNEEPFIEYYILINTINDYIYIYICY